MRKIKLKKALTLILAGIMMISCFTINVFAEDTVEEIEIPCYHSTQDTETEVSAISQALIRGAYLSKGTSKLTNLGGGVLSIYGSTTGYQVCNTLYLDLYLERSSDGVSWSSYDSWSNEKSSASSLSKTYTKSVARGYYYRVRGYHAAKVGSTKETTSTKTNAIYVG